MVAAEIASGEIAKALSVSASTVSIWRRLPEFQREVASYYEDVQPQIYRVRYRSLLAMDRVITEALIQMNADDAEGRPNYPVRQKAMELLANCAFMKSLATNGQPAGVATAAANASVTFLVRRDAEGAPEVIDYVGEIEEVTDEAGT